MSKIILALAVLMAGMFYNPILPIVQLHARVILKEKIQYYQIIGNTGQELFNSMIKHGPDFGRKENLATTKFKFDLKNKKFGIKNNRCILKSIDIVINATHTRPKWRGSKSASTVTSKAWKNFQKAVISHQNNRIRITKKFASEYERALKKSRKLKNGKCSEANFRSNFSMKFAINKHERAQKLFSKRDLRRGSRSYKATLALVKAK